MLFKRLPLILIPVLMALSGCDSATLRALDEATVALGGQSSCYYESSPNTNYYDGYSVTLGGYCNYWEASITNNSRNTVKCRFYNANSNYTLYNLYAKPGQVRENVSVGGMSSTPTVGYNCQVWARAPFEVKRTQTLVLQEKIDDGRYFSRVQNNSRYTRTCHITEKSSQRVLKQQSIAPYQWTSWTRTDSNYTYGCR